MTATSAVASVATRSSTAPDRNDTRSTCIVAARYSSLAAAIRSACAAPRLNARSVGSPRTTSRKWFESRASARHRARVRASVDRPISAMNTGISGSVTSMISADVRSTTAVHAAR